MNPGPTELKSHTALIYHFAFSPDGKWLASGGVPEPGAPATGAAPPKAPAPKPSEPGTLATGAGLKLWDVTTMKESKSFQGHEGPVTGVLFTADSSSLLSIG